MWKGLLVTIALVIASGALGVFNDALIHRIVDGRAVKSHGTMEMPVWGDAFRRRLGLDDDAVRQRIEAIVRYVGAIQERSGH